MEEGPPCLDTGTAEFDGNGIDDITDFVGGAADMGAFEFICNLSSLGDVNDDYNINILDVVMIVNIIGRN